MSQLDLSLAAISLEQVDTLMLEMHNLTNNP